MKIEVSLHIVLLLLLVTIASLHCKKQNDQPIQPVSNSKPCTVKGNVSNEYNQSMFGADLVLQGNGINTSVIATNGDYIFDSLQAGSYTLSVNKDG
jgi:hypothetical protein